DILFLEEFLSNDSPSLPENESFHFDIPSSPRPPAKPPDDVGIRFVKVSLKIGFVVGAFQIVVGFVVGFGNLVEMQQKRLVEIQKKLVARESSELG
ncbi:hypothetical protein Tco_1325632, partial [Tanacetum coccineum]